MIWTKRAHQCTFFQTFGCPNESSPNCSCHFFKQKVSFSSKFGSFFSVMRDSVFSWNFTLYTIDQSSTSKWKFPDLQPLPLKYTKFLVSFLEPKFASRNICFWQKESINIQFLRLWVPKESSPNSSCRFWNHKVRVYSNFASQSSVLDKISPSKLNCQTFEWLGENSQKFLMSYMNPQVSVSLNFESVFSVMRDNSSVLF